MASTFVYDISILMRIDVFTFNQWSIYIINYQISKNKEYDTTQVHNQTKMNDILRYISLNSKNNSSDSLIHNFGKEQKIKHLRKCIFNIHLYIIFNICIF